MIANPPPCGGAASSPASKAPEEVLRVDGIHVAFGEKVVLDGISARAS